MIPSVCVCATSLLRLSLLCIVSFYSTIKTETYYLNFQYGAHYTASKGRLNNKTTYIAQSNDKGQWVQVDFGKIVKLTKIGTQGRYKVAQWITKYTVSYSIDGGFFQYQLHKPYNFPWVRILSFLNREYFVRLDSTLSVSVFKLYIVKLKSC